MIYPSYVMENTIENDLLKMLRGILKQYFEDEDLETNTLDDTSSWKNESNREYNQLEDGELNSFLERDRLHSKTYLQFKSKESTNSKENFIDHNYSTQDNEIEENFYEDKFNPCKQLSLEADPYESIAFNKKRISDLVTQLHNYKGYDDLQFFSEFYKIFRGQFFSLSLSRNGSKLLQDYVKIIPVEILSKIFDEIKNNLPELIISIYGNYFSRMLYIYIKSEEKLFYLNIIKDNFYFISTHRIGTYPLQFIIENVNSYEEKFILIECLKFNERFLHQMAINDFAVHILDKILLTCEENLAHGIYRFCLDNFINLSFHKNGIFLIKRIMNKARDNTLKHNILQIMLWNFSTMINDTYANYAILYAIENWDDFYFSEILKSFLGKMARFSCQKHPSLVVEKLLEKGGENVIRLLIYEMSDKNNLFAILNSKFGMYVIKKALALSSLPTKIVLLQMIWNNINLVKEKSIVLNWLNICQFYGQDKGFNSNPSLNFNTHSNM